MAASKRRKQPVSTKVQGKLTEVFFREGADLKVDEVAAQLDDIPLKADIKAAQAVAEQAREDVKSAMSQQELAGVTLRRTQELIKKGFISAAQLDKDVSAMRTANASLAAAKSRVAEADAKVASLQANLNDLTLNPLSTAVFSTVSPNRVKSCLPVVVSFRCLT